jgi:excisionase family DNA binding protein
MNQAVMDQALYTVEEAAGVLKLHPKTLRRKIRAGEIEFTQVGKRYRFTRAQLEAYCGSTIGPAAAAPIVTARRSAMSVVIDVTAISPADSQRISNYLMASLNNSRVLDTDTTSNTTAHCQYLEASGELKILISGSIGRVLACASLVESLLQASVDSAQEASP